MIKMSRQSEFKKRFDPEMGKYTRQHIWGQTYGEGIIKDKLKKVLTKSSKKAGDKIVSMLSKEKTPKKTITKAVNKPSKKAGDKIVSMLSKEKTPKKTTQQQRNARVNSILTGGKII